MLFEICLPHLHIPLFFSILRIVMVTMQAQEDDRNGFLESAQTKASISLGLNTVAAVLIMLGWILFIGIIVQVSISYGQSSH